MVAPEIKKEILSHFKCQNSGNCCRRPGFVYVNHKNIDQMAKQLRLDSQTFKSRYVIQNNGWTLVSSPTFNTDCFLDNCNKCQVYSARPTHCRTYPDWPEIWLSKETLVAEAKSCPGLAQAIQTAKIG